MNPNSIQVGGKHYQQPEGVMQHWDFTWVQDYNQFEYCISKYVHRWQDKNGIEDLRKAKHHLEKYISLVGERDIHPARVAQHVSDWAKAVKCDINQRHILILLHVGELEECHRLLKAYIDQVLGVPPREYTNPDL